MSHTVLRNYSVRLSITALALVGLAGWATFVTYSRGNRARLGFEAKAGQNGAAARFLSRGGDYSLFLTPPTTFTVNSTDDTNDGACTVIKCTLRDAINAADLNPGADTVNFSVTGTINLLSALPDITDDVMVDGPGANQLMVQRSTAGGTPKFRIFTLTTIGSVTFSGLTIRNGDVSPFEDGGGILNISSGTLNVISSTISDNSANVGGGISAPGYTAGTVNVINSTLSGNSTNPFCTCSGGWAGGLYVSAFATANVINSSISGNSARSGGGGVYNDGPVNVTNSTISGNSAESGGGIRNGYSVHLLNSIIALNSASSSDPDLMNQSFNGVVSQGHNIIGVYTSGGLVMPQPGDQFGVTATQLNLGPLANNGGPTQTMALNSGSVAIDAGDDSVLTPPLGLVTDQRGPGFPRQVGAHVDIGAFEATCSASSGNWTTKAPMPTAVIEAAGVVSGGKFYVMDGASNGGASYPSEVYDPTLDSWSFTAPDPVVRAETAAGVINNKIYVAEGWLNSDSNTPTTALEIYDPATNSWTSGAPSLIAKGASARAVIGTKLYVAGGTKFGNSVKFSDLEIYDSVSNSWSTGASLPTVLEYAAGAAIGGKFYVVGGDSGPLSSSLFIYDPSTNSWSTGAPIPTPRTGLAAGVINGRLYAVGGSGSSGFVSTLEIYDPTSNSWTTGPAEPTARYIHVAGAINSTLYVTGGYSASGVDGTLDVFNADCSPTPSPSPTPTPQADLSITKTALPSGNVTTSSQITYTITVNNAGSSAADNVNVNDPIPSGTTFSSFTTSQGSCTAPSVGSTSPPLNCSLGTINAGGSATITLKVDVTALPGATVHNTATVSSTTSDPNPGNNSAGTSNSVSGCDLVVMNINDSGAHTLRLAIQCANANPGLDTITFNIPGAGVHTITPLTPLPAITDPVVIDGYSQPGSAANTSATSDNATLLVEINGSSTSGPPSIGLSISSSGSGSTLRGLVINRFSGAVISVNSAGNHIEGNFININANGTAALGSAGIAIAGANNFVGGVAAAQRNVISGTPSSGVSIGTAGSTGNMVQGNFIGINAAGNSALGNGVGVSLSGGASNNTIGGGAPGAGNVISGNTSTGVMILSSNGNFVQGNFIGTNAVGTAALGNRFNGISINGGANNTIGGTVPGAGNLISGNLQNGVQLTGGTVAVVQGNFIGTNASGTSAIPNSLAGVLIEGSSHNSTVGGTASGAGNLISGNTQQGIVIAGNTVTGNLVQGNLIGTDVTGSVSVPNRINGVVLTNGTSNNQIGGTTPAARNVISGNTGVGVVIHFSATGNSVQGNFIGTKANGTQALGNTTNGVHIGLGDVASGNIVGGTTPGAGNVISGNSSNGVLIQRAGSTNNLIQGNFIGTDVNGTTALGNGVAGVNVTGATNNTIGGVIPGARNIISANGGGTQNISLANGVVLQTGAASNQVQGNYIGTDVTGNIGLGNFGNGVFVETSVNNTIVGNVISANGLVPQFAGLILSTNANGNQVQGNYIGTNAAGTAPLGNGGNGIVVGRSATSASNNTIGGTSSGAGNVMAFNARNGILVINNGSLNNVIRQNSVFSNGSLGIDLGAADGVTPNDGCDSDIGANRLQNFPVLTLVSSSAGSTTIQGAVNSAPNTTFTLEFFSNDVCDPSGFGEGQTFIGSTTVTTDGNCTASFTFTTTTAPAGQPFITATATDPGGNTSEFSACGFVNADVSISKTASPNSVVTGSDVTYTLNVNYDGPAPAANMTVTDNLPPQTTFKSLASPSGWNCTTPAVGANGTVTCTKGSMATSESPATFTIVATVDCSVVDGTAISDTATVSSTTTDTNPSNNSSNATVTASNPPPTISCPADKNVSNDPGQCSAMVDPGTATATDNCAGVTVTGVRSDGRALNDSYPTGSTTITWTATDSGGNSSSCKQKITVSDTEKPVITCPANMTVPQDSAYGAIVNYPAPAATDNCPGVTTSCAPASGSNFALGSTTVKCTATDASGNTASCSFRVTVVPPTSTVGVKSTDGGSIPIVGGSGTFGIVAMASSTGAVEGDVEYQDHVTGMNVKSTSVTAIVVTGTHARIFGKATINGSGSYDFVVDVDDLGEPGIGSDKFGIQISNGYNAGPAKLSGGNIQIHN
jgi:uncharacterized repeat protein (TIGR01451 family)/CSLREA domain-containing protein